MGKGTSTPHRLSLPASMSAWISLGHVVESSCESIQHGLILPTYSVMSERNVFHDLMILRTSDKNELTRGLKDPEAETQTSPPKYSARFTADLEMGSKSWVAELRPLLPAAADALLPMLYVARHSCSVPDV